MIDNRTAPYAALLLRVSLGVMLLAHGLLLKVFTFGVAGTVGYFQSIGYPGFFAYLVIARRDRRRPRADPRAVDAPDRAAHAADPDRRHAAASRQRLAVLGPKGGWEFPAFWTVMLVVQALLGDGAYAWRPALASRRARPKRADQQLSHTHHQRGPSCRRPHQPCRRIEPRPHAAADPSRHPHRPRPSQGGRSRPRARLLLRRARLRADAALRQPGRLRRGRRLSPPHRPQHLGEQGRLAAAARHHRPLSTSPSSIRPAPHSPMRCKRLVDARVPLDGASDHGVSEALYLRDPDGNGIELYWDRDEADWPRTAKRRARHGHARRSTSKRCCARRPEIRPQDHEPQQENSHEPHQDRRHRRQPAPRQLQPQARHRARQAGAGRTSLSRTLADRRPAALQSRR